MRIRIAKFAYRPYMVRVDADGKMLGNHRFVTDMPEERRVLARCFQNDKSLIDRVIKAEWSDFVCNSTWTYTDEHAELSIPTIDDYTLISATMMAYETTYNKKNDSFTTEDKANRG